MTNDEKLILLEQRWRDLGRQMDQVPQGSKPPGKNYILVPKGSREIFRRLGNEWRAVAAEILRTPPSGFSGLRLLIRLRDIPHADLDDPEWSGAEGESLELADDLLRQCDAILERLAEAGVETIDQLEARLRKT